MRTLNARLERLSKWRAPAPAPEELVVVYDEPTPAQVARIAQAQAAGRRLRVLTIIVVPAAVDTGGSNGENPKRPN